MTAVLDASALLALLNSEPGSVLVAEALSAGVLISTVNLAEVVAKLSDYGVPEGEVREALMALGMQVATFGEAAAFGSGSLRRQTKAKGLSLGDRACLALALEQNLPVLTADRHWDGLVPGVQLEWLR